MGNVKWPVYRPLGLCGVLLLAGKPASSGERVKYRADKKTKKSISLQCTSPYLISHYDVIFMS